MERPNDDRAKIERIGNEWCEKKLLLGAQSRRRCPK
jgi:hypothetical protein